MSGHPSSRPRRPFGQHRQRRPGNRLERFGAPRTSEVSGGQNLEVGGLGGHEGRGFVVCGAGLRELRRQWKPGLGREASRNSACAGAQTMSGARTRRSRGARISTPCVVQARISLLGANTGSSRIHLCGRGQDIAPVEATRRMLRTVVRATKCAGEMKILAARAQPE